MISKISLQQLEGNFLAYNYVTFYHASFAMTPLTSESPIVRTPINGCKDYLDARIAMRGTTGLGKTAILGPTMSPGANATCKTGLTTRQGSTTSRTTSPGSKDRRTTK